MLNFINHQGNANQNHNERPLDTAGMVILKKASGGDDAETADPRKLLVGMKNGANALGNSAAVLKMLNIEIPYDPSIPLLGIYPKELETYVYSKTCP